MHGQYKVTLLIASLIGGVSGGIAGLFGTDFGEGLITGLVAGLIIGAIFSARHRGFEDPSVAIEAFSPAGLAGAVVASVVTEAGWIGAFISCGLGWALGLFVPAILIATLNPDR